MQLRKIIAPMIEILGFLPSLIAILLPALCALGRSDGPVRLIDSDKLLSVCLGNLKNNFTKEILVLIYERDIG